MDFSHSQEQELLQREMRHFLDAEYPKSVVRELEASELGYSPDLWKKMADLGWVGLIIPEEYDGAGGNLLDLAVLFEEIGRAVCPCPMFSTVVLGALPVLEKGNEEQKNNILSRVASGEYSLTLAFTEPEADYEPGFIATSASYNNGGFTINGTKLFVQNAHIVDYLLVVARTSNGGSENEGLSVFIVDSKASGINLTPLKTISADRLFEVEFNDTASSVVLGEINTGWPLVESTLRRATAIRCVEMVGLAQKALELTNEYSKTRIQFDRPIGSFQAVQHQLVDMFIDIEGARWTAYQAVWRLDKGLPAMREVSIAKAWTSNTCQRVIYGAQHIHGGVGMDMDYDLQFYFRRAKALELSFGTAPVHTANIQI